MTRKKATRKEIRDWRIKKITMYIVSLAVLVIGMVQGVFSDPLKEDIWKPITGFIIFEFGFMSLMETYQWSLRNYLYKKSSLIRAFSFWNYWYFYKLKHHNRNSNKTKWINFHTLANNKNKKCLQGVEFFWKKTKN